MRDDIPVTPPLPSTPAPPPEGEAKYKFDIGEEFGTAKRNLPPAKILAIALAILLVVAAAVIFTQSRPTSSGSIEGVNAVDIPNQNSVLVAINLSLHNGGDKPFYIHTLNASISTEMGDFKDEAASPIDFDRYFQAFPELKQHTLEPLKVETKIPPGGDTAGTIIVSFPLTKEGFDKRKSLSVTVQPYDQRAVVLTKK